MTRVERLTNYNDVKTENINFGVTRFGNVTGKNVTYERIPITIEHGDDYGSLLIKTEKCFTFGIQQNLDKETGKYLDGLFRLQCMIGYHPLKSNTSG